MSISHRITAGTRRARIAFARSMTLAASLVIAASALAIAGCGGDGAVAPITGTITISPSNPEVALAETVVLVATVDGAAAAASVVHWSSADPSVATVSDGGLVTAVAVGTARIAASSQGRSAETTVRVVPPRVARVEVVPAVTSLTVGDTTAVRVSAFAASGEPLTGRTMTLTSATPTVVAVIDGPRAVALAPGAARLTATVEGVSATVDLAVGAAPVASVELIPDSVNVAIGGTTRLVTVTRDRSGAILTGRAVTFASSSDAIASVAGDGTVIGVSAGRAEITATAGGIAAKAVIIVPPPTAAQLTVTPATATLLLAGTVRLEAVLRDADGKVLTGRPVSWSSTNTNAAQVSPTGVVTATGLGVAVIVATSQGLSASAGVTVVRAPVTRLTVVPTTLAVAVGDVRQLAATALDASGAVVPDVAISWTSSAPAIAVVSSTGEVRALTVGTATITAAAAGLTATSAVTVSRAPVASITLSPTTLALRVGATGQLTATPRNAGGATVPEATVTWSSSNAAVATVTAAGVVKALTVGTTTITATSEGRSATAAVTVSPPMVASLTIAPTSLALTTGDTRTLVATARDADGGVLPGASVSWTSSAPGIVAVSAAGKVTAMAVGSAAVTATSEGVSASASVTVTRPAVLEVRLSPTALDLTVGASGQIDATPLDASGIAVTDAAVSWSSSAPAVASVSSTGVVTAMALGTAQVTAASEGKAASATVTVKPPAVATVELAPPTLSLAVGATSQLVATPRDAGGNAVAAAAVTWSSDAGAVADVSPTGLVTARAVGTATITATSEGKSATAAVTVTAPPVATVEVAPPTLVLDPGQTGQLTATAKDGGGNVVPGTVITWSSSDGAIATISASGRVTAVAAGVAIMTATAGGVSGTASVTVQAAAEPPDDPAPGAPSRIVIVSGDGQEADRGSVLPERLVIRVVDAADVPVPGVLVIWLAGNGGQTTPDGLVTGADGTSSASWRLGNGRGDQTATALVVGVGTVTFRATAERR